MKAKINRKTVVMFLLLFIFLVYSHIPGVLANSGTVIDITDYSAVPDDTGDDTSAVKKAIEAANPGDTVHIPAGTYIVSGSIKGKSGVTIEGESQSDTILKLEAKLIVYSIFDLRGVSDATVRNLTIDCNGSPLIEAGIEAENSSNILINHVTVKDMTRVDSAIAVLFSERVTNSEVSDCTMTNIGVDSEWGTGVRVSHGSSNNRFLRNVITNVGRGGILADNNSTDLVIRENVISGTGTGDKEDGEGLGIELWGGCHRGIIEDNTVDHWISLDHSDFCAVRRNKVTDDTGQPAGPALEYVDSSFGVFTDNYVDGSSSIGISQSNSDGPELYAFYGYNTIKNCNNWGAQLQGEGKGCMYQYFYKTDFLDTRVGYGRVKYPGSDGIGLRFNEDAMYLTFDSCNISGNERDGVQFLQPGVDYLSFVNCTISNNAGSGFASYKGYNAFEAINTVLEGNENNTVPQQKAFKSQKPEAAINCPDKASVGQPVSFESGSYDTDGNIKQVLWDFNDGIPSDEPNVSHVYSEPGDYRVTLIVWDDEGRGARAEKIITVTSGADNKLIVIYIASAVAFGLTIIILLYRKKLQSK